MQQTQNPPGTGSARTRRRRRQLAKVRAAKKKRQTAAEAKRAASAEIGQDWGAGCTICGQTPTVPITGMCGPCTWGEGDTAGGNW